MTANGNVHAKVQLGAGGYTGVVNLFDFTRGGAIAQFRQDYLQRLKTEGTNTVLLPGKERLDAEGLLAFSKDPSRTQTVFESSGGKRYIAEKGIEGIVSIRKEEYLSKYFTDNVSVIMLSCSQGAPGAFAQSGSSRFPGMNFQGPEEKTSLDGLAYDGVGKDGSVNFTPKWSGTGNKSYSGGRDVSTHPQYKAGTGERRTATGIKSIGGEAKGSFPVEITPQEGAQCVANSFYYALSYLGFRGEKSSFINAFQNGTGTVLSGPRSYLEVENYAKSNPNLSSGYVVKRPVRLGEGTFKTPEEAKGFAKKMLDDLKKSEGSSAMMVVDGSPRAQMLYGMEHSTMIYAAKDAKGQAKLYEVNTFGSRSEVSKPKEISEDAVLLKLIREQTSNGPNGPARTYEIVPYSVLFISKPQPEIPGPIKSDVSGITIKSIPKDVPGLKIKKIEPK
jgi:hypothetical protein